MAIAYFDCFSGISGDMILGALVDAGVDFDALVGELNKLSIEGYRIERRVVKKHEITGTKIDVIIETEDGQTVIEGPGDDPAHREAGHHHHDHASSHAHGHAHPHPHHGPTRRLRDLAALIEAGSIDASIKRRATAIFDHLAAAEGVIHGVPKEEVHLHEVSGMDAIIDITGACIGLDMLGIEAVYASPLPVGSGFIRCAHGRMPVPAPGALELLRGIPIYQTDTKGELVTPTGAAFLKTVAAGFGPMPRMVLKRIGYGAGTKDLAEHPNLLRVCVGEKG
jgi:uncharacterized protein (TIGR00299 family) protein